MELLTSLNITAALLHAPVQAVVHLCHESTYRTTTLYNIHTIPNTHTHTLLVFHTTPSLSLHFSPALLLLLLSVCLLPFPSACCSSLVVVSAASMSALIRNVARVGRVVAQSSRLSKPTTAFRPVVGQ